MLHFQNATDDGCLSKIIAVNLCYLLTYLIIVQIIFNLYKYLLKILNISYLILRIFKLYDFKIKSFV